MTDTHSHPYLPEFENGGEDAVKRALASGVAHIVMPNVDAGSIGSMKCLHEKFPQNTSMAMGLHPTEVGLDWEETVDMMETLVSEGEYVAVGEVGIDMHWSEERCREQMDAFCRQIQIAEKMKLPLIIHSRDALGLTLECLKSEKPSVPLVFHSFTGTPEDVAMIRKDFDVMFGINGVVTFKNAGRLREAVKEIGINRILLETDAPYLTPVPHRGNRNEPSFLTAVCAGVASGLSLSIEEAEAVTDINARMVFGASIPASAKES